MSLMVHPRPWMPPQEASRSERSRRESEDKPNRKRDRSRSAERGRGRSSERQRPKHKAERGPSEAERWEPEQHTPGVAANGSEEARAEEAAAVQSDVPTAPASVEARLACSVGGMAPAGATQVGCWTLVAVTWAAACCAAGAAAPRRSAGAAPGLLGKILFASCCPWCCIDPYLLTLVSLSHGPLPSECRLGVAGHTAMPRASTAQAIPAVAAPWPAKSSGVLA